jgi:hypothetical protein
MVGDVLKTMNFVPNQYCRQLAKNVISRIMEDEPERKLRSEAFFVLGRNRDLGEG